MGIGTSTVVNGSMSSINSSRGTLEADDSTSSAALRGLRTWQDSCLRACSGIRVTTLLGKLLFLQNTAGLPSSSGHTLIFGVKEFGVTG